MSKNGERNHRASGLLVFLVLGWEMCVALVRTFVSFLRGSATSLRGTHSSEETARAADRNLNIESGSDPVRRRRWGTFLVVCAFVLAVAAGVEFLFIYWSDADNMLLGGSLAVSLAGFGSALVLWAHSLMRHEEATEPREMLASPVGEREALAEDYCTSAHEVQRRSLLKWMVAAAMGIFAAVAISLLRSLGTSPVALFGTDWKRGQRLVTIDGTPVSIDALKPGSFVVVFPEDSVGSEKVQTVLVRVNDQLLQLPNDRASWAPMGYVAYSRVCTHAGCPVGMYESTTNLLMCPCHQSTFDVLRAALPTGGPAARPLPQLPIYADLDGNLRAGGGFSEPPGPGFWGMP